MWVLIINTLRITFNKKERSLYILLNRPKFKQLLNAEMLFELESILSWVIPHVEINCIILSSTSDVFCNGYDYQEFAQMEKKQVQQFLVRLQKLVYGMLHLPQTLIADFSSGACGLGIELALGCDVRVARKDCKLDFHSLQKGLVPSCGGIGLLSALVGNAHTRNWLLSSANVRVDELLQSGLVYKTYEEEFSHQIIESIASQSQIARIQCKRSLLEKLLPELERALIYEPSCSFVAVETGEYKKAIENKPFTSPLDLANSLERPEV